MRSISSRTIALHRTSLLRDLKRDWRRWSAGERTAALWLAAALALAAPMLALLANLPAAG